MKIRHVAFAVFLIAGPLSGAMAQQTTGPDVGAASKKEDSAVKAGSATHVAGATGRTVVPGSNSTVAGDKSATASEKTRGTASSDGGK